jgi:hypothetical protein
MATVVPSGSLCSLEGAQPAKEGKRPMKKSFRVGTVLTGAAACAAAFGPTAAAATTATAAKPVPSNVTEEDCTAADSHWVHMYWLPSADHGPTCLGYKGTKEVSHSFDGFCAGNNHGWLSYISSDGELITHQAFSSKTFILPAEGADIYIFGVHISGYAGSEPCPSSL